MKESFEKLLEDSPVRVIGREFLKPGRRYRKVYAGNGFYIDFTFEGFRNDREMITSDIYDPEGLLDFLPSEFLSDAGITNPSGVNYTLFLW